MTPREKQIGGEMTVPELKACPFCGSADIEIHEVPGTWQGMSYPKEPLRVEVRHHCQPVAGELRPFIEKVGRDRASAIAAWNRRADHESALSAAVAKAKVEGLREALGCVAWDGPNAIRRAIEQRIAEIEKEQG